MGSTGGKTRNDHNDGSFRNLSRLGTPGWGYHSVSDDHGVIAIELITSWEHCRDADFGAGCRLLSVDYYILYKFGSK